MDNNHNNILHNKHNKIFINVFTVQQQKNYDSDKAFLDSTLHQPLLEL